MIDVTVAPARAIKTLSASAQAAPVLPAVTHGVFFSLPPALPRGRHDLSREQVEAAHRERAMIAATELMAAHGYAGVGVREICAHAQISRGAFYLVFEDKAACVFTAYDRFIAVVLDRLASMGTAGQDWRAFTFLCIETYLRALQEDLVVARAFQVEMDSLGREARRRRRDALIGIATFLRNERIAMAGGGQHTIPLNAYVGAVYAVRQLASDALDEQVTPDLPSLIAQTSAFITQMLTEPNDAGAPTQR